MLRIGGIHWDPYLIGWGQIGRPKKGTVSKKELLGYWNKKHGKGKMSHADRTKRTVDFWKCKAVYALFDRGNSIYVGEGVLGDCLLRHWKNDTLVGRWNAFSWISPFDYGVDANGTASVQSVADTAQDTLTSKELVELLELVAIRLGSPEANSQLPSNDKNIKWMTQLRSTTSIAPLEDKIDEALELLAEIKKSQP
jgi:hypothetical protein